MNNKKWFASDYGIEEVELTGNRHIVRLSDGTEKRVRSNNLFDDSEAAFTSFKQKIHNSKSDISRRNRERYRSYSGHLGDDKIKEMFTITSNEEGFFDQKLIQDAKEQNSIKSFFKDKIKSFDVETTGLDSSDVNLNNRARIWQAGLAIEGEKGVEKHTNPLKQFLGNSRIPNPMALLFNGELKEKLRKTNGKFSEETYLRGGFNEISKLYDTGRLPNLDSALQSTLGSVSNRDILVLQNMNFENNILKSSREQGLISDTVYDSLLDNMYTTGNEKEGFRSILQTPADVQRHMRRADLIYKTQFLVTNNDGSFNEYLGHLNNAISSYKSVIDDPNRSKAVAVELQDITKYFLAHAADKGYVDKNKSVLGLNVDFLSRSLLGEEERHTALSDATQTITLMKKMLVMGEELESGNVSKHTENLLNNLHEKQKVEIDRGFLSSIGSVIHDFKTRGYTSKSSSFSYNSPENNLIENGKEVKVDAISISGKGKHGRERSLNNALDSLVERYDNYGQGSLDRENYVNSIKESFNKHKSYSKIQDIAEEDLHSFKTNGGKLSSGTFKSKVNKPINLKKVGLIGAGIGLAYMWLTPDPGKKQEDYSSASEDYYDDQYLGTEFVNYKERNKHYMM